MNHISRKSSIINHKYQSLKGFVNDFNFPDPVWKNLPPNFPNVSKESLSREEKHLLDGITLAWQATQSQGRSYLLRKSISYGFTALALILGLAFSNNIAKSPEWRYVREVSAATISATLKTTGLPSDADELNTLLESTMSGVLKRK